MDRDKWGIQRRVAGQHNFRLDGISDLLHRARGAAIMDVGCNRGMVGYEFYLNGATTVHGCDNYELGITVAREVFADLRSCSSQFEVVDLSKGHEVMQVFKGQRYDTTVMLATYHKLKRVMDPRALTGLVTWLGKQTDRYFAWRGTSHQHDENNMEMIRLDADLSAVGYERVHTSTISTELGIAAIWARK